ncbi:guanine nucleotide-binding protein subunit beta-like protein 1 isoform X2 [Stegodyphus dumicola]|uniref:guanine nucleotide-binding protein subunit beta-like protein 1 isoform X2 n=1 Tax=Stegodyphus dumicola TaxID=202533 RepID=UPI0015AF1E96|nr:guanine nucleotide-binding protein subunit beta-like protein 1 isoform X2 [Stegodyphus dumicola]
MGRTQPLPLFILKGHEGTITSLHFTTEKDHAVTAQPSLISGSDCGEIFIWSLENNRTYHRFSAHDKKMIMFLCYYKSSLLSQGRDGMINVWNYTSCEWIVMNTIL